MKILKLNMSILSIMLTLFILFGGTSFLFSQEQQKDHYKKQKVTTQEQTGNLIGVVIDDEGMPLPNVTIEASGPTLKEIATTVTDETGSFQLLNLPSGTYTVFFALPGFKTVKKEGIMIQSDDIFDLRVTMRLRTIEEDVTAWAASPVIDQEKIEKQWATERYVLAVATDLSKFDKEIKDDIKNLTESIKKLQSIVNQLIVDLKALRKSFEDYQKEHKDLNKRLKDL